MRSGCMRWVVIAGVLTIALAAAPSAALADTTIGSDLSRTANANSGNNCNTESCTFIQTSSGTPTQTSPIDGTVTSWKLKTGSASGTATLHVLRKSGATYTSIASTSAQPINIAGLNSFTANLAIKAGDLIAVDNASDALIFASLGPPLSLAQYIKPALANGSAAGATGQFANYELLLQANVAPGTPGGGGGGGTTNPTTPSISALKLAPSSFKAATSGASVAAKSKTAKTGSTVSYKLSADAAVKFAAQRAQKGRKSRGKCQKAGKRAKGKRCTFYKAVSGSFSVAGISGSNSFKFTGRVSSRKLGKGKYRLSATPSANGKTGSAATASFKIK